MATAGAGEVAEAEAHLQSRSSGGVDRLRPEMRAPCGRALAAPTSRANHLPKRGTAIAHETKGGRVRRAGGAHRLVLMASAHREARIAPGATLARAALRAAPHLGNALSHARSFAASGRGFKDVAGWEGLGDGECGAVGHAHKGRTEAMARGSKGDARLLRGLSARDGAPDARRSDI